MSESETTGTAASPRRPRRADRRRRTRREVYEAERAKARTNRELLTVEMRALLSVLGPGKSIFDSYLHPLVEAVKKTRQALERKVEAHEKAEKVKT